MPDKYSHSAAWSCTALHCTVLQVRQSAGLLLKNNLKAQYAALSEDFRNYIKVGYEPSVF